MVVSIRWLGHASFQIESQGKIIYIDLVESSKPDKKADLILVTHSHTDHCDPVKIQETRMKDTVVIAPEDCVSKIGGSVKSLKPGEGITVEGIHVKAVEAYNYRRFRSPGQPYHPQGLGVGYLISVQGKTIYHAGDTDFIPQMRELGPVNVALLPSGGTYTMDNTEAASAALAINPEVVIPMHRWDTAPEGFKEKVEADSNIKVVMLKEAEAYEVAKILAKAHRSNHAQ